MLKVMYRKEESNKRDAFLENLETVKLDSIEISVQFQKITISVKSKDVSPFILIDESLEYQQKTNGCEVFFKNGTKADESESNYISLFYNDFQTIISNRMKKRKLIPIMKIELNFIDKRIPNSEWKNRKMAEELISIMREIKYVLRNREIPLSVNIFEIQATNENQILSILPFLDPSTIQDIIISAPTAYPYPDVDMNEIVKLEQWKNAKNISALLLTNTKVANFTHVKSGTVYLQFISIEHLEAALQDLLLSPKFKMVHLKLRKNNGVELLTSLVGPPDCRSKWIIRGSKKTNGVVVEVKHDEIVITRRSQSGFVKGRPLLSLNSV
uniref:FTH domain-containing protein n=1 Tax=Caenorhabditis tropicalis TaxID=1561998 RepID=A0A1I7UWS3_9PELO